MKLKDGVTLAGIHPLMRPVLREAERIWLKHGRTQGVTVTGAMEGLHSAASFHYYGLALDFRTRYFDKATKHKVDLELSQALPNYDVVMEDSHMHVEVGNALANKHGLLIDGRL